MFTARVSFLIEAGDVTRTSELAFGLLACWYQSGQIISDTWAMAASDLAVDVYVTIAAPDALDSRHDNSYVTRRREGIAAWPKVEVLGVDPGASRACSCVSPSALVLLTHYLTQDPPVCCLDCFRPVPLYRLPPVHDHGYLVLLQWAADYRACDTLQMNCTTGERFGELQMLRHDSSLSRHGRDLAATLERQTGSPVYYYLHKMRSRGHKAEQLRRCPACGADWRLDEPLHDFDLRCDPCRLLSSVAADVS